VLAITVAIGLGVAEPALASERAVFIPTVPVLPDTVAPTAVPALSPEPTTVPTPEPPALPTSDDAGLGGTPEVVIATQTEAGSVNVSVRVLSPGSDAPVTQETSASDVVSAAAGPDITPAADPVKDTPPEDAEAATGASVNTNVSVRVLSPGDSGTVSQTNGSAGNVPFGAVPPSSEESVAAAQLASSDSTKQAPVSEHNSPQYQTDDSQYQSEIQSSPDPWIWSWELTLGCGGNSTSVSTQTGSQASLIWTWEWAWEWACTDTASDAVSSNGSGLDSSSTSDPGNTNMSVRVLSPGDNGPVTQSTTSTDAVGGSASSGAAPANERWSWTWTFTFCGQTASFSTQIESGTPLNWTWDWAWDWACNAAVGAPPDLGAATQPGTGAALVSPPPVVMAAPPAALPVPAPTVDVPPLPFLPLTPAPPVVPLVDVAVVVVMERDVPLPALPDLPLPPPALAGGDVAVVIVPTESSPTLAPGAALTPEPARTWPSQRQAGSSVPPSTTTAVAWQPRESPTSRPTSQPTAKRASAHAASPRPARSSMWSFGLSLSSQTAGSGTSGGLVPSAPVVAVAALVAFFMFADPSLGRRVRAARELSPRGTYRSSIDHPG